MTREQQAAIDAVVNALRDKGPRPDVHDAALRRLKRQWPTLARALAQLLVEFP